MSSLTSKSCQDCKDLTRLTSDKLNSYLAELNDWSVIDDQQIERHFQFKNFKQAVSFVNSLAQIAEQEGHHPDIFLHSWNKVKVTYWTHDAGGLTLNDFIMAAKTDKLV